MRCKNCGWPNKPNEKVCVKCHAPLDTEPDDDAFGGMNGNGMSDKPLNKTVLEDEVFGAPSASPSERTMNEGNGGTKTCPKCGYPVRIGSDKCPNCNFPINQSYERSPRYSDAPSFHEQGETMRRPTRMNGAGDNQGKRRGTINPYMMNLEMEPTFVLKPLKRMNERHDFEEQEYEGQEVILNRDNTEQNNPSITSRQQAVVSRVDGRWYIEDKSDQKTTFVQAGHKVELHDGDLILLGNRLFEFHE